MSGSAGDKAKLLDQLGVPADVQKAVGSVKDLVGQLSGAYSAFTTGVSVLQFLGILSQTAGPTLTDIENEIDALRQHLDSVLSDLANITQGIGAQVTRDAVWTALSEARGCRDNTLAYAQNPDAQLRAVYTASLAHITEVVRKLEPNGYWVQAFTPRVYYDDVWVGTALPPGTPDGYLSFDYRLQLPAYVEAVSILIIVLMAQDPGAAQPATTELSRHLGLMVGVHDKILAGFLEVPLPTKDQAIHCYEVKDPRGLLYYAPPSDHPAEHPFGDSGILSGYSRPQFPPPPKGESGWADWTSDLGGWYNSPGTDALSSTVPGGRWWLAGRPVGVIDRYGAVTSMESGIKFDFPSLLPLDVGDAYLRCRVGDPNSVLAAQVWRIDDGKLALEYARFRLTRSLKNIDLGNSLYWNRTGLGALRVMIVRLSAMVGQPPPPIPDGFAKYTRLSLRDAAFIARDSGLLSPGALGLRQIAAAVGEAVWQGRPVSLRQLFFADWA